MKIKKQVLQYKPVEASQQLQRTSEITGAQSSTTMWAEL